MSDYIETVRPEYQFNRFASPRRVEIQRTSHRCLRKFSDEELRTAAVDHPKASELAHILKCNVGTVRAHADRLGIKLRGQKGIVWRPSEDALLRQCAAGLISVATITKLTKHSAVSIRLRAKALRIRLIFRDQKSPIPYNSKRGTEEHVISVGKVDKLLLKLNEVFGAPRNEIYPGSRAFA